MKNINLLKIISLMSIWVLLLWSCNTDELDDIKERIAALEAQELIKDSVIFESLIIDNQTSMNLMAGRGITNILGQLEIRNCNDISPLLGLKSVGSLYIKTSGLTSLHGLENLEDVGYVDIYFDKDVDISALDGLESLNYISLYGNLPSTPMFMNLAFVSYINIYCESEDCILSGFEKIVQIEGLDISGNQKLSIQGFNNLLSVEHMYLQAYTLEISGLNKLATVQELYIFAENSVTGMNNLRQVYGDLLLDAQNVNNFLNKLSSIGGTFHINSYSDNNIKNFTDLEFTNLESIGGIGIASPTIESLNGFDFSKSSLDEISFFDCPKLNDISALSSYSGEIEWLAIINTGLASLTGLENITAFRDGIEIHHNLHLGDMCAIKDIFDEIRYKNISDNLINPIESADISGCN